MKKFIGVLSIFPSVQDPLKTFCDNESVMALAKERKSHKKTRYIKRRLNYIQHEVEDCEISIHKVHIDQSFAYPFMKPLP